MRSCCLGMPCINMRPGDAGVESTGRRIDEEKRNLENAGKTHM
jgi:hypothetical protein